MPDEPPGGSQNGGDAEVDVNDVGHALQQVIRTRETEDTWQVDSFSGVLNISRPPDEAIVLCLELSESMSRKSGVQTSAGTTAQDPALNPEVAADSIAAECIRGMKDTDIVDSAKTYLQALHPQCLHPWTTLSKCSAPRGSNILEDIALLAARDLLQLSFNQEGRAGRTPDRMTAAAMKQLSCFIRAVSDDTMNEKLRLFLIQLLDSPDMDMIGSEPFSVPRKFIDFRTGELLTDPIIQSIPVTPHRESLSRGHLCSGCSVPLDLPAPRLKRAVATWVSGTELWPQVEERNLIIIDLRHGGETTSWRLRRSTTTRTLYSLAHRATLAKFSGFALKICGPISSNSIITESPSLTLEGTALSIHSGIVEIIRSIPHTRKTLDRLLVHTTGLPCSVMTDITLCHGLRDSGDGTLRGTPLDPDSALLRLSVDYNADVIVLESRAWVQMSGGARQAREESRHLTRLHLLKELFNVFLNRAMGISPPASLQSSCFLKFSKIGVSSWSAEALFETEKEVSLTKLGTIPKDNIHVTSPKTSDTEVSNELYGRWVVVRYAFLSDGFRRRLSILSQYLPRGCAQLETMLYSGERSPCIGEPFVHQVTSPYLLLSYQNQSLYPIDLITVDKFPPRAAHPLLAAPIKSAAAATSVGDGRGRSYEVHHARGKLCPVAGSGRTQLSVKIKAAVADPYPHINVYFNDSDMPFFKVILEAEPQHWYAWYTPLDIMERDIKETYRHRGMSRRRESCLVGDMEERPRVASFLASPKSARWPACAHDRGRGRGGSQWWVRGRRGAQGALSHTVVFGFGGRFAGT
ncbi:hypothetical protein B0H14DRAFT_3556747 [Mycena olivaceomarginata]|nr:hypothetical protein B0H14DRAFT_3556747 [Mycena olivaceomarginata]